MRTLCLLSTLLALGAGLVLTTGACGGGGTTAPAVVPYNFQGTYFLQVWEGEIGPPVRCNAVWGSAAADGLGMVAGGSITENNDGVVSGPMPVAPFPYTVGAGGAFVLNAPTTFTGGLAIDGSVGITASLTAGDDPGLAIVGKREGTYSAASLSGTYHLCAFFYDGTNDNTWYGGNYTFDGAGNATWTSSINQNGTITPAGAPVAWGTYTVAPDGAVTLNQTASMTFHGGIMGGGELVVLSGTSTAPLGTQALIIMIRAGSGMTNAALSGTYHAVFLTANNTPPPRYACFAGTGTSNGVDSFGITGGTVNSDGTPMAVGPAAPGPYSVAPDGALAMGTILTGAVSQSGRYAAFSGFMGGGSPFLWVLVR